MTNRNIKPADRSNPSMPPLDHAHKVAAEMFTRANGCAIVEITGQQARLIGRLIGELAYEIERANPDEFSQNDIADAVFGKAGK